jgi:hypothetical protein
LVKLPCLLINVSYRKDGTLLGRRCNLLPIESNRKAPTTRLLELFCDVDDFWQCFQLHWEQDMLRSGAVHKLRQGHLSVSEMMTIMIHCH